MECGTVSSGDETVYLDVGGTLFRTTRSTLAGEALPSTAATAEQKLNASNRQNYFTAALFHARVESSSAVLPHLTVPSPGSKEAPLFIDRDPELFALILRYLRTGMITFTKGCSDAFKLLVLAEFEWYGLPVPRTHETGFWHAGQLAAAQLSGTLKEALVQLREELHSDNALKCGQETLVGMTLDQIVADLTGLGAVWPNMKFDLGVALKQRHCVQSTDLYLALIHECRLPNAASTRLPTVLDMGQALVTGFERLVPAVRYLWREPTLKVGIMFLYIQSQRPVRWRNSNEVVFSSRPGEYAVPFVSFSFDESRTLRSDGENPPSPHFPSTPAALFTSFRLPQTLD